MQTGGTHISKAAPVGTIKYMAPETIFQDHNHEGYTSGKTLKLREGSDVWSCGILLYELIYRRTPWDSLLKDSGPQRTMFAVGSSTLFDLTFPDIFDTRFGVKKNR